MTPAEAFGHLRETLPAAIDRVVAEGVGREQTRNQIAPYAGKLRAADTLDHAVALDEQLGDIVATDPPVRDRLMALTADVRQQAEAETIPGQVRQAAKDVKDAAKTALTVVEAAAVGYVLWKIFDR